jgi:hypothetical protein
MAAQFYNIPYDDWCLPFNLCIPNVAGRELIKIELSFCFDKILSANFVTGLVFVNWQSSL